MTTKGRSGQTDKTMWKTEQKVKTYVEKFHMIEPGDTRTENPCVPGSIPGGTTQKRVTHLSDSFFVYIQLVP